MTIDMAHRLLILNCSSRKLTTVESIPALELYDGPMWQVLRSFLRGNAQTKLHVYALSAAFGLIQATRPIKTYDQTMSPKQAEILRPDVLRRFRRLMSSGYKDLCLGLSKPYFQAMNGWEKLIPPGITVTVTDGAMGVKLGQLQAWLENRQWEPSRNPPSKLMAPQHPRGRARLAGVEISLSRDQVLEVARQAIAIDSIEAMRLRDWYVDIDGQQVSPKWLASLISGVPTKQFDASAARRVLLSLGFDVERTNR